MDWAAHCREMGLSSKEFFQIADSIKIPKGQLTPKQEKALLNACKTFVQLRDRPDNIIQGNLFD